MMKPSDTFTWLAVEGDNRFGELCEVVSINGDKVEYRFVDRPNWSGGIMPASFTIPKKQYTKEEISAIRTRNRKRFAGKF